MKRDGDNEEGSHTDLIGASLSWVELGRIWPGLACAGLGWQRTWLAARVHTFSGRAGSPVGVFMGWVGRVHAFLSPTQTLRVGKLTTQIEHKNS